MNTKLCIILGAGASASINLAEPEALDNPHFRPVTTPKIFQNTTAFRDILNHYPLAQGLSASIHIKTNRGESLEAVLKFYSDQLLAQNDSLSIRQFLQVPLYLNELFHSISRFTRQPREYDYLIDEISNKKIEVLFLTLNYDGLLEMSLQKQYNIDFDQSNHYFKNVFNWKLVKLHGSINWYTRFHEPLNDTLNLENYLKYINRKPVEHFLDDSREFIYQKIDHQRYLFDDLFPLYPVIAVPVEGKYKYYCPEQHYLYAKQFLQQCFNYLIIGTKGLDHDLIELLRENANCRKLMIVGRNGKEKTEIIARFRGAFKTNMDPLPQNYFSQFGFSDFISDENKGLDKYLKIITES